MEELDELVFWVKVDELFIVLLDKLEELIFVELVVVWFPEEILEFPVVESVEFIEFTEIFDEFVIDEFMFDKFVEFVE